MAESIPAREQVMDTIEALLMTGLDDVTILRSPDIEVTSFPTIALFAGNHFTEYLETRLTQYTMAIELDLYVAAPTHAALEPALHALWAQVVQLLMADVRLGGKVFSIVETGMDDPGVNLARGQGPDISAALQFEVIFHTPEGDPYTLIGD